MDMFRRPRAEERQAKPGNRLVGFVGLIELAGLIGLEG
jgi:hypothetical protein